MILYRESLNELQRRILEAIRGKEVTTADMAKKLGVSERTVRKYLSSLCSMGLVARKRIGRTILYCQPEPERHSS